MRPLPDVLVLGGGGVLAEAWMMGILAGIEDATGMDLRDCETFVGTSAGAILAAHLASGRSPRRPPLSARRPAAGPDERRPWHGTEPLGADHGAVASLGLLAAHLGGRAALTAGRPLVPLALRIGAPAGALARSVLLRGLPGGSAGHGALRRRVSRLGAAFDGRLRVVAVDRETGARVVFGSPGAPDAGVADAVVASCAVPGRFAPVTIGGRRYVDGGTWSLTNLDAAPAGRDTQVLCLNPVAGLAATGATAAPRAFARAAAAVERQALLARGARVLVLTPDDACAAELGADPMDPGPRASVLASGYRQGATLAAALSPSAPRADQAGC